MSSHEFEVTDGTAEVGRTRFDLCVIHRNTKLRLESKQDLVVLDGRRSLKLGQRFDFQVAGFAKPLHTVFSHWPSRLYTAEEHTDRHLLGMRLRDKVDEIFRADSGANIILAGDYNDEPFSRSLSEHVKATRDRQLASSRSDLLYNPFWRHLTYSRNESNGAETRNFAGSYFHRGGLSTKWRTFDQFMFSQAFLGAGEWELDDQRTLVLNIPAYTKLVLDKSTKFDHLPVMSVVRRKTSG